MGWVANRFGDVGARSKGSRIRMHGPRSPRNGRHPLPAEIVVTILDADARDRATGTTASAARNSAERRGVHLVHPAGPAALRTSATISAVSDRAPHHPRTDAWSRRSGAA